MEFRILGPLEACADGRMLPVRGEKQKALLAILLLHANQVVSSERLVDELWPDEPPESGLTALQVRVSQLRKSLEVSGARNPIITRAPGYVIQVESDELDVLRFERLTSQARRALEKGDPGTGAGRLRQALALWRGPALADFVYDPFAQTAIARLEELRIAALEQRIEADLALGEHADLVGELEALVGEHPLRERLRRQLMLALYRSGRQAEALEAYRDARQALVEHVGIEPGPALRELEKAILEQDSRLDHPETLGASRADIEAPERSILVVTLAAGDVEPLLSVAEPLARHPPRELIFICIVGEGSELAAANALVSEQRAGPMTRGVTARAAAFTSAKPGEEVVRLALDEAVDLLLIGAPPELVELGMPTADLRTILEQAPCDVGVLVAGKGGSRAISAAHPVLAPFGGAEHDWAAIEIAAWIAAALNAPLRLLGTEADPREGTRDASRLLARASLVVQRVADVVAEPFLVPPGADGILRAAESGGLLVVGLSTRKRQSALGDVRLELVRRARAPVLLVHKGLRPGGIAPSETLTRFTWSLAQLGGSGRGAFG
jgi:DNA-binding SARP family transcriptional activator